MHITIETFVAAPPEAVYATLTNVLGWRDAIPAIQSIEMLTPGPVTVGSRFRETRLMFGRIATEEMTVTEMAAPERFVLTASSHGTDYLMTHVCVPEGGGTRLTLRFAGKPVTLMARIMAPIGWLMAGAVRKAMEQDFAALKRSIEATSDNG